LKEEYNSNDSNKPNITNHESINNKSIKNFLFKDNNDQDHQLKDYNNTFTPYPDKTIVQLFEEQVEKTPGNVAVVFEDVKLTYGELNKQVNKLANYLIDVYGLVPDDKVALILDRSELMIVSILAVLKSGAAYVPISPDYPSKRINYILDELNSKVIIVNEKYQKILKDYYSFINIDKFFTGDLVFKETNPVTLLKSSNLAYVIFTSGTTGEPKGVMIEHVNVVNLVNGLNIKHGFSDYQSILFSASYTFDASVDQIFLALSNGYKLVVSPDNVWMDNERFMNMLIKEEVSYIHMTSSLIEQFDFSNIKSLKVLLSSGEPITPIVKNLINQLDCKLLDVYGITETTVFCIWHQCSKNDENIPIIGSPLPNVTSYILDKNLNLLPLGAIGELYIGGVGLARGYLNNLELTNEKFILNPYQTMEQKQNNNFNSRIYKTGDLVRYLKDGNIEYMGRNDSQVKIRGFRIELGEIESKLSSIKNINASTVIATDDEPKQLIAYYVSRNKLNEDDLRFELEKSLPNYMLPSFFIHLKELPLTINGKLDVKALPKPDLKDKERKFLPAVTVMEKQVVEAFSSVLGVSMSLISLDDNFFYLGGDSIKAIHLVNTLKNTHNLNLAVADVFSYKTVEKIAKQISLKENIYPDVKPYNFKDVKNQVLSFAQERLWFIDKYENGTNAYNIPLIVKLKEKINLKALSLSIIDIVNRHEVLSSVIKEDDINIYQEKIEQKFRIDKVSTRNPEEKIKEIINHIFKLNKEFPIKTSFISDNQKNETYLVIVVHHIAFDGWSTEIFIKELIKLYEYYSTNDKSVKYPLNHLFIQYKDFSIWQRNYLKDEILNKQLKFWKNSLDGFETLNLPLDFIRPQRVSYDGDNYSVSVGSELTKALKNLAKNKGVSLYTLMLSIYYLMLKAYSNQNDIVVGSIIANRHVPRTDDLIGFFVNSQALRINLENINTFDDLLDKVTELLINAQIHQDLPFEKLVSELNIEQDQSRHPIFQVMFTLQNFTKESWESSDILEVGGFDNLYKVSKFDLTCTIGDSDDELSINFEYATKLFTKESIENFANTYLTIIKQIINTNNLELTKLQLVDQTTKKQLVQDYNNTFTPYPDKTIVQLFEKQVKKTPDNIAVVFEDIKLTYEELNNQVNKLANYLIDIYGLVPDDKVALVLDRSELMIISILAVLKSGASYVPINPDYPSKRINYIFDEVNSKVIIVNEKHQKILKDYYSFINIDKFFTGDLVFKECNPVTLLKSNNLAYVIFTSGTSGDPKGVMIEHNSLVNHLLWMGKHYNIGLDDSILQKTTYTFDVSVWELILPIISGSKLVFIKPDGEKDPNYLCEIINKQKISIIHFVPVMLNMFLNTIELNENNHDISSLRYIFSSGEALSKHTVYKTHNIIPSVKLDNLYGPTEATIDVTYFNCDEDNLLIIPIGKPIQNTSIYILDKNLNLVLVGAIGELYVGGVQLARGYLNNPELTNEKFIPNPYQTIEQKQNNNFNSRIYKTGDLVRYLKDGNIEYMGRNDSQVKIRGFRIELGEIESKLSSIKNINASTVIATDDEPKQLIAYYVSRNKLNEDDLRFELEKSLPDYMLPSFFIHLKKLPLTINGKLDKSKLPEVILDVDDAYQEPKTELEFKLVEIWSNILKIDENMIPVNANFFYIGGNSILAVALSNKINKVFDKNLNVSLIFKNPTIKKQALLLIDDKLMINEYEKIVEFERGNLNNTRLIFAYPGDGGAESYNKFSKLLDKNIPFYAIDNYNFKHPNNMIGSLKDIAKEYISYLNDNGLIEDNNFILGGWSLGGTIAFEICYQLEKMNKKPKKLLIFDSYIKNTNLDNEKITPEDNEETKKHYIKKLGELGIKEGDEFFKEMLDIALKNNLNNQKMMDEYLPLNNINTNTIYYHSYNDNNLRIENKKNHINEDLGGFRKYLKSVEELQLNAIHNELFFNISSLKIIIDSIEKMYTNDS
jgi:amino acid adenylation domain-containing protein